MSDTATAPKATPEVAFCFLLNQLLNRERWARERLVPLAGQALELRLPLVPPLRFTIGADGRIVEGGTAPLAAVGLNGIVGEGPLADELRFLAKHLRPDVEEELSRLVGDVAAARIGAALRGFLHWQRDAALRVGEALTDYATDEQRLFVRRAELERLAEELRRLGEALERLDSRVGGLDETREEPP